MVEEYISPNQDVTSLSSGSVKWFFTDTALWLGFSVPHQQQRTSTLCPPRKQPHQPPTRTGSCGMQNMLLNYLRKLCLNSLIVKIPGIWEVFSHRLEIKHTHQKTLLECHLVFVDYFQRKINILKQFKTIKQQNCIIQRFPDCLGLQDPQSLCNFFMTFDRPNTIPNHSFYEVVRFKQPNNLCLNNLVIFQKKQYT